MSFQNDGVKSTITLKISRRPMSINSEQSHLTLIGSVLHDITGPISVPSDGPTLLMQLSDMVMALVLSIPKAIMIVAVQSPARMKIAKNAIIVRIED